MKRAIIVENRESKDEKTGDELLFIKLCRLPSKMTNGGLWYSKPSETIVNACINKTRAPQDYKTFHDLLPGTLCDITFGINDFNNKTFVAKLDVVEKSPYVAEQLYV